MSEESRRLDERTRRALNQKETSILRVLLGAGRQDDLSGLQVVDSGDQGTRCLLFINVDGVIGRFGREIGTATYMDEDGVLVSISLNVDDEERLFELDFWKVNFEHIKRFPEAGDLEDVMTGV